MVCIGSDVHVAGSMDFQYVSTLKPVQSVFQCGSIHYSKNKTWFIHTLYLRLLDHDPSIITPRPEQAEDIVTATVPAVVLWAVLARC